MLENIVSSLGTAVQIIFIPKEGLDYIFYVLIYSFFAFGIYLSISQSTKLKRSILKFKDVFIRNKISKLEIKKEDLEVITKELEGDDNFDHPWCEFKESLRVVHIDDGLALKDRYLNTLDSEHFFKSDSILSKILYTQYLDLIPGILTGLGILGTFLGIVDGLNKVDVADLLAVDGNNKESLNRLFDGVKTCFKTSALGITLSLGFSALLAKIYRSSEELFEKNVIQIIDSHFKRHTEADSIYELIWF